MKKIWKWLGKNHNELLVILTFLALIATILIASTSLQTQINLANESINFLKQTSSTNWANVEMRFNQEVFVVDAERLANPEIEKYPLDFVIINSGKINTGQISVNPLSDKIIYPHLEPNNDINISSQMGKEARITIIKKNCYTNPVRDECNQSIIPHNESELNLNFKCQFCQPDQISFNITIPLCIYHNQEERTYCNEKY